MADRIVRCHHADANAGPFRAHDRDGPGKSARGDLPAEVHVDLIQSRRRKLPLGGVEVIAGHAQPRSPLNSVRRAAGKHRQPRAHVAIPCPGLNAAIVGGKSGHARPRENRGAVRRRSCSQRTIEAAPINHDGLRPAGRVRHRQARRRDKTNRMQRIQNRLARQIELVEAVGGDDAGAMNRVADGLVLFAHDHLVAAGGQPSGGV